MDSKSLRILYMGTPDFAVEPLRLLVEGGYNVVGVVTVADKPAGRGQQIHQSAVKRYAVEHGLNVFQPEKLKEQSWLEQLRDLSVDLGIVVAFRMLPEVVWSMPKFGTFNLHASLLPRYRGAAPINWAIMNGDKTTGVTTFFLNHEIDCGEIIAQKGVKIGDNTTAGELHDTLMEIGANLVIDSVDMIAEGAVTPAKQLDIDLAAAPKIFKPDCKIDWRESTITIYNKIRGLSPYPAAWFDILGTTAKVFQASYEIENELVATPGTIESDGKTYMRIACCDGWLYVAQIQVSGKKTMSIADFLRGNKLF